MLSMTELVGFGAGGAVILPLIDHLASLNLTTNLRLCLDAGDPLSAPASPTKWLDRSGNGYDFDLGTTSSAQSTDPVFNGSVGGLSDNEYWSFDGTQYFEYDSANEGWMQNIHKNNSKYTFLVWMRKTVTTGATVSGTLIHGSDISIGFKWRTSTVPSMRICNNNSGGLGLAMLPIGTLSIPTNEWFMTAFTYDEASGDGAFVVNGNSETFNTVYSSPSGSNASRTMQIGATNSDDIMPNGSRMAEFAVWEGVTLTTTQINQIYEATRTRFNV